MILITVLFIQIFNNPERMILVRILFKINFWLLLILPEKLSCVCIGVHVGVGIVVIIVVVVVIIVVTVVDDVGDDVHDRVDQ
jgi:hypothetical protein